MYYRHILTYNFSNDEARLSFEELIVNLGYTKAEDQSTYVLPYSITKKSKDVLDAIIAWSVNKDIHVSSDDFIQLFYLFSITIDDKKATKIKSTFLKYNPKLKGLI